MHSRATLCFQHILLLTILSQTSPGSRNPSLQLLFLFHKHFLILVPYNLLAFAPSTIFNKLYSASLGKLLEFQFFKFLLESLSFQHDTRDKYYRENTKNISFIVLTLFLSPFLSVPFFLPSLISFFLPSFYFDEYSTFSSMNYEVRDIF